MKKSRLGYGICLTVLVLLYGLLSACSNSNHIFKEEKQQDSSSQVLQEESNLDALQKQEESIEDDFEVQDSKIAEESVQKADQQESAVMVCFEVRPGAYLQEILQDLVELGWGENCVELLQMLELKQQDIPEDALWSLIPNPEERAFAAEGYIAPGIYEWEESASIDEVLDILLTSWDRAITGEMLDHAMLQGYTVDEILIMASIVEWESSFDPHNIVKNEVAAVVRNRIESETPLQMDVTIFYLQEALEPYRDPQLYEDAYDTYIRSTLPAGPIGSPSLDSIAAVLKPADTHDLFFVYDEEGNYYFAEDYDQHLVNCQLAGIY